MKHVENMMGRIIENATSFAKKRLVLQLCFEEGKNGMGDKSCVLNE